MLTVLEYVVNIDYFYGKSIYNNLQVTFRHFTRGSTKDFFNIKNSKFIPHNRVSENCNPLRTIYKLGRSVMKTSYPCASVSQGHNLVQFLKIFINHNTAKG